MKTEKNMRKGFGLAGKIAMFCIGLVSFVLTSCESELEIQQSYPFTVETMPVPKELNRNETAEIRCELKSEGDFDGTVYAIRYFQYDGEGSLKLDNGLEFKPNDSSRMTVICWRTGSSGCIILHYVTRRRTSLSLSKTTGET